MKKSTKLLSVILAIVMIFSSMSVLASAAKANYKTVDDLEANQAYSPYGAVTRLSTEERMSMVFDYLDNILESANINMGQLFNVAGLSLTIDLRSINAALGTVDNVASLRNNGLVKLIAGLLGILKDLDVSTWQSGMTREGTPQLTIVYELLEFLNQNRTVVSGVLRSGSVDLGVASSALAGLDLSIIADIPGLIKGMIYPLFERWDDTTARADQLANTAGNGGMEATLNEFVQRLFTNNMSITTYKEDAAGNCISDHSLPSAAGTRQYYEKGSDANGTYIQVVSYDTETKSYKVDDTNKYYKTLEEDSNEYVFVKTNADGTKENLKYYKNNSQFLPSFAAAVANGTDSIDLLSQTPAELFYKFIPYVFAEMAPVVLNGSVKKLFAGLLGAQFTYIGEVGSAEVKALADSSDVFFTQAQGDYLWEWSDYKVINGNHYYRFEDQIYVGDINDVNKYFGLINWEWNVPADAINEFIPGATGEKSAAGYSTLFQALNDFVAKVIDIAATPELKAMLNWQKGDNSMLIVNIKSAARALLPIEPEIIFGSNYQDEDKYYDLIMTSDDNQEILVGVACTLLDFLMPQLILPTADTIKGSGVKLGAIFAAIVRELATQFLPTYNYDALIYADYNNKSFVAGKDNNYWLDVCLTMATDIGMSYLRNLADLGEDTDVGYKFEESKTYTVANFNQTGWEATIDWIIDWALTDEYEWGWNMITFVDTYEDINLATTEDPWAKLGDILNSLLPINMLLNVDTSKADWAKTALRDNLVMGILDLDLTKITGATEANGLFNVPMSSVLRTQPTLTAVVSVIRDVINNALAKVANGDLINASTFTGLDTLLNQGNLASFVETLLNKLFVGYQNGLLEPFMPILNFFIGWKTDPQTFVTPALSLLDTANSGDYLLADGGAVDGTFTVRNDSAGMLLRRAAGVYDSDYVITIKSITPSDSNLSVYKEDGTSAFAETTVMPWAKATFRVKGAYAEAKAFYLTVKYTVTGKDGSPIGGEQTKIIYGYMDSAVEENTEIASYTEGYQVNNSAFSKVDAIRVRREAFNKIHYAPSVSAALANLNLIYTNTAGEKYETWVYSATGSNIQEFATVNQDYVHGCNLNSTLKANGQGWMDGESDANKTNSLKPVNYNPLFDASAYVSGTFIDSIGGVDVVWHNHRRGGSFGVNASGGDVKITIKTPDLGSIYIVDLSDLESSFNNYDGMSLTRSQFPNATEAQWNAFVNAMLAARRTLSLPYMMDKTTFTNEFGVATQERMIKALDDAYAALAATSQGSASASGDVPAVLKKALATAETGDSEINYQDYRLYEYFKYQDERTEIRNRIRAYEGPVAPENRIDGSSLSAEEIDAVIASASDKKAFAIRNTVIEPTAEELQAYSDAMAEWTVPSYSDIDNENAAALLTYYKRFLQAKTTEKQFLAKEIAYANAQNYVEANYSADSWAAYTAAYDNAVAVNNDGAALQSQVFDAKYALMKAENELLRKDRSVKELGLMADLEALVAQAEIIFNYSQYYAPKADILESDAYAALIKALGYNYTDENGNEQTLYYHSAADFLKNDRENTASNLARIASAEAALKAAIDNFECTVKLVENDGDKTTEIAQGVRIINGITPGSIANINALMSHVKASAAEAVATPFASASGFFGTGAKVDLSVEGIGVLTTYYVVIYGDVNGDGAIDAFDAAVVNQNLNTDAKLTGVYKDAAMVTEGDDVELADYSAIFNAAVGAQEIEQNRA